MIIYILTTSLSMPAAMAISITGGVLFGIWVRVLIISFTSTIGAMLACFVSRYLLRDWVQRKFWDRKSGIILSVHFDVASCFSFFCYQFNYGINKDSFIFTILGITGVLPLSFLRILGSS